MLWVYAGLNLVECMKAAKADLPENAIDLSKLDPELLARAVDDFCNHHVEGHIFLGYVDPLLMLHPTHETLLRRGFRGRTVMSVVVSNPYLLPLSWKNGCEKLRLLESVSENANSSEALHHGGAPHVQDEAEYGRASAQTPPERDTHQGGKARRSAPRRKQAGQNQAPQS